MNRDESQSDPILLPFLCATTDKDASDELAELISVHAEPVVKRIVGYKFQVFFNQSSRSQNEDADDVLSQTLLNLLARLNQTRSDPQLECIHDFRGYVAVTSYRACYEYLRRKYPLRFSLKNKLRYFLRHQNRFALWQSTNQEWVGGFSTWEAQDQAEAPECPSLRDRFAEFEYLTPPPGNLTGSKLNELLTSIFKWANTPVELDELVGIVARVLNIKDQTEVTKADSGEAAGGQNRDLSTPDAGVSERSTLVKLWRAILDMSARHCAALLLNMKDDRGGNALDLFLFTGVASFAEIAAAIGETEEWLAEIWNRLPLEDSSIAEHLGLVRQQVINLRKTARTRLSRHLNDIQT